MNRIIHASLRTLGLLLLSGFLLACNRSEGESAKEEGTPVSISGRNYTIEGIQEFSVNGQWGGGVSIGGGNSIICCIVIPDKWKPGLTAEIEWRRSDCGGNGPGNDRCPFGTHGEGWHHKTLKTTVPIEPYDQPYTAYVVFLPNDEVKIYITPFGPSNPKHPSKLGPPHPIGHPEWKPYQP